MQRKETEAKLSDIRGLVESGSADEEVVRDFYLLHVRRWVTLALEEIDSINQEMEILKRMEHFKQVFDCYMNYICVFFSVNDVVASLALCLPLISCKKYMWISVGE